MFRSWSGWLIVTLFFAANPNGITSEKTSTVRDALKTTAVIAYPAKGRPVDLTVAKALQEMIPQAKVLAVTDAGSLKSEGVFRVAIADEGLTAGPQKYGLQAPSDQDWMFVRLTPAGDGELVTSKPHLLYALFCRLKEEWINDDVASLSKGRLETATFRWLEGGDGFFLGRARQPRGQDDPEKSVQELARLGCSHLTVNDLATPWPYEEGPPGEIYYRFYAGSPDLDQFAETELDKGIFPPEYLQANMNLLKKNAALALKYGLTPGLYICSPRSVPEALLERYPFLRGARIDHTFRSTRPRYTLTLAHPVVRWHYAELMKKIMHEVPQLGYVGMRTNDAGSGFEYTVTTYPGRNGGAYLIREWKSHDEIAKAATQNILRYYRLLRDAASEINPQFRVITSLGTFPMEAEGAKILSGLGDRLDLYVSAADAKDAEKWAQEKALLQKGSYLFGGVGLTSSFIPGVPFPWLAYERLSELTAVGLDKGTIGVESPGVAPYNINKKILMEFQLHHSAQADAVIAKTAENWVGAKEAPKLIEMWQLCDQTVRTFPSVRLYEGYGFYTLRPWIRPLVPNIEKIPEAERAYYEKYLNAIFNNPNLVDFTADALWTLIPTNEAEDIVAQCDREGWKKIDQAIAVADQALAEIPKENSAFGVFADQRDRFVAQRCYYRTLRNLAAWIAGVHGYVEAKDEKTKAAKQKQVRDMALDEIQNCRELLKLWQTSQVEFMPVSTLTETMYTYGENFGELLEKKIALMEAHKDDTPYINPNFMWRMPPGFPVDEKVYLKY